MILFIIGIASGIISGMGIGGGVILIPALVVASGIDQHTAQGINLIYFIPTAIIALVVHIIKKRIEFKTAIPVILTGLAGAYFGSRLALSMDGTVLRRMFGVFLLVIGAYELYKSVKRDKAESGAGGGG